MSGLYYSPSIFETYNARHLSPEKVAQSFVPPDETYSKLATYNNHIITGPRGSGKTTLLKMLTLPALLSWDASQTQTVLPKVDFMGIFVPADRGWATQIKQYGQSSSALAEAVGKAAFTSHVLMAFCTTLENFQRFEFSDTSSITHQPQKLEPAQATKFVDLISSDWGLVPRLPSLAGLKLALRSRLLALKSIATESNLKTKDALSYYYEKAPFAASRVANYPSKEEFVERANMLRKCKLICGDFETVALSNVERGDFVYLDPPYYIPEQRVFLEYSADHFGEKDFFRLSDVLIDIERRGAKFLLSYPDCDLSKRLATQWNSRFVDAPRSISAKTSSRKKVLERIISNY